MNDALQEEEEGARVASIDRSGPMLREVLAGDTYDTVATRHGLTRTGVERRIKALATRLVVDVGIDGINVDGAAFVRRLRANRQAVLDALESLQTHQRCVPIAPRNIRILSEDEVAAGARRVHARSPKPLEDLALYYFLLSTGARPLEIARLQVCDFLGPDGAVRSVSEFRAEVAITGRARPLYFGSTRLNAALCEYLAHRAGPGQGSASDARFRGLDPLSPLFVSPTGRGFEILTYGANGQRRFRCRAIQETCRKIWRYADFKNFTTLAARHTVADRLYSRGADEAQVGVLLGISERAAVREIFPRRQPTLGQLTDDLV